MGEGVGEALRQRYGPSRLTMIARAAALAIAAALSAASPGGGAHAEASMNVAVEAVGDWDQVSTANYTFFVTAVPNARVTRAFCAADLLRVSISDIVKIQNEGLKRWDIAPEHGCVRLACHLHGSDAYDIEVAISANAPARLGFAKEYAGVTLRLMRGPDDNPGMPLPATLFEHADIGARTPDGAAALLNWSVSDKRQGPGADYARVEVSFSATYAFVEKLATNPRVIFGFPPGEDRQIPQFAHDARDVTISTAGVVEAVKRLKQMCPEMRRRARGG